MASSGPVDPLKHLIRKYQRTLSAIAKDTGKKAVILLSDFDDWEDHVFDDQDEWDENDIELKKDPAKKARLIQRLTDFLQSIPYVLISPNAHAHFQKLCQTMDVVGRKEWDQTHRIIRGSYYYEHQYIIAAELEFVSDLIENDKYPLVADSLIAVLLVLKFGGISDGWSLADNHPEPQEILNRFGSLWEEVMGSDESELDNPTKRVLYDVIQELHDELVSIGYDEGIPFGEEPDDIEDVEMQKIQIRNITDSQWKKENKKKTKEQLEKCTVKKLRTMCQKQEHCAIDYRNAKKQELMEYLLDEESVVTKMKMKYHYEVVCKKRSHIWLPAGMSEKEVHMQVVRSGMFDERRYAVRDGIVVVRDMYEFEISGEEPTEEDDVMSVEEAIEFAKKASQATRKQSKKRKIEKASGKKKAAKRRRKK